MNFKFNGILNYSTIYWVSECVKKHNSTYNNAPQNMQFLRKGREVKEAKKKKSQGTVQYHKLYVLQEKMTAYFLGQGYWKRGKIK